MASPSCNRSSRSWPWPSPASPSGTCSGWSAPTSATGHRRSWRRSIACTCCRAAPISTPWPTSRPRSPGRRARAIREHRAGRRARRRDQRGPAVRAAVHRPGPRLDRRHRHQPLSSLVCRPSRRGPRPAQRGERSRGDAPHDDALPHPAPAARRPRRPGRRPRRAGARQRHPLLGGPPGRGAGAGDEIRPHRRRLRARAPPRALPAAARRPVGGRDRDERGLAPGPALQPARRRAQRHPRRSGRRRR